MQGNGFSSIKSLPSKVLEMKPSNGKSKQKANVDEYGTPAGKPHRDNQRLPEHERKRNPAPGHAGKAQRHGKQGFGTGDIARVPSIHGTVISRIKIAQKGKYKYLRTTELRSNVQAPIDQCELIARNPKHLLRWKPPSQQKHQQAKQH